MNTGNKEKVYWTIKEVSDFTGIKQSVLRFWERKIPFLKPLKNKFGHRAYRKEDIDTILKIKNFLYGRKMTIKGAIDLLNNETKNIIIDYKRLKKDLENILEILRKIRGKYEKN